LLGNGILKNSPSVEIFIRWKRNISENSTGNETLGKAIFDVHLKH
jgi:hypothetical protein